MAEAKVDTKSSAYMEMAPRLAKISALMGGTETMRAAGSALLPQYSAETNKNYKNRLARATLFGYFKKTVCALAGKPFSRELQVSGMDPRLEPILEDADLQGNSLHVWAQEMFQEGLAKGLTAMLVDFPENPATSASEELKLGLRPFFIRVPPESLLAVRTDIVDGREVVVHARIAALDIRPNGRFGEDAVEQIFVWEPDTIELFEKVGKQRQFASVSSRPNALGYVPLLIFYGEKTGPATAISPLNDLADKNIEHWQSASDQRHILTVARFPMLGAKGISEAEAGKVQLGPQEFLASESPTGEFYYVEHRGAAIAAGRTDLQDIKAEMASLAMDLLAPKSGRLTATEYAGDQSDSASTLRMLAIKFKDLLEQAFVIAGDWMDIPAENCGEIELFTEFELSGLDAKALDALVAARNKGDLDSRTFLEELRRRGILRPDLDIEDAIKKGQEELAQAADAEAARLTKQTQDKLKMQGPQDAGPKNGGEKPQE